MTRRRGTSSRGFTMIEATIALALLALLMGVVAPSMTRWYAAVALRVSVAEIHQAISALQGEATFQARDVDVTDALSANTKGSTKLPKGWALEKAPDVKNVPTFWRNGSCTPGTLWLSNGKDRLRLHVRNAMCELEISIATDGGPT